MELHIGDKGSKAMIRTGLPTCSSVAVKQNPFFLCSGIVASSTSNTLSRRSRRRYEKARVERMLKRGRTAAIGLERIYC
jgi:hypothetical protein